MKTSLLCLGIASALALSACAQTANQTQSANGFRYSEAEMQDIASANKLSHRVFYAKPSTGENAAWFDAVKRGDLATVKKMVAAGQNIEAKDSGSLDQTA